MPEQEQKILRIKIDGTWTSSEFAEFMYAIGDIYSMCVILADSEGGRLRIRELLKEELVFPTWLEGGLDISRIRFGSAGFTDLAGRGTIVGCIKDFLLQLIQLCNDIGRRRLETEQLRESIRAARIEDAEKLVNLAKKMDLEPSEFGRLVDWVDFRQMPLLDLVEQGKIQGVQLRRPRRSKSDDTSDQTK